jgi:CRP/FNR family transcriptional regulator, anaerobic regulatory protein
VHYLDAAGREGTLYRIGEGQSCILALNCLFARMASPAWAEASEEGVSLAVLDGAEAAVLTREEPAFFEAVFAQVSGRLYDLLRTLEHSIRLPLSARVASALLALADGEGVVSMSQERLADHVASSREAVSRILRDLVATGLVQAGFGRLTIIDRAGLTARAAG